MHKDENHIINSLITKGIVTKEELIRVKQFKERYKLDNNILDILLELNIISENQLNIFKNQNKESILKENLPKDNTKDKTIIELESKDLVDEILGESIDKGVSDIHIESLISGKNRIRLRVDGKLHEYKTLDEEQYEYLIDKIKEMSLLDRFKKHESQDGEFRYKYKGKNYNARVSIIPLMQKEKVCIRVLPEDNNIISLENQYLTEENYNILKNAIRKEQGLILVTGPTGSGKSTTMFSLLKEVNNTDKNIMTIEDPIEIKMEGINQIAVTPKMPFERALKSILRQDPDIIMIGEMRDNETAEIAVKASMTGHLVISTLHTNDAISSVNRLIKMGISPLMVADSLNVVVNQRLVRRLCENCKVEDKASLKILKKDYPEYFKNTDKIFTSKGCEKCNFAGYFGRIPIQEILCFDDNLRRVILSGDEKELDKYKGDKIILKDSFYKIKQGLTDYKEVREVLNGIL